MVDEIDSQQLVDTLTQVKDEGKTLYIVGHVPPDYDSIGSALGLARIAEHLGLEAKVCCEFTHDAGYLQNNILYNELELDKKVKKNSAPKDKDVLAFCDVYPHDTNCAEVKGTPRIIVNHHPITDDELQQYSGLFTDTRQAGSNVALIAGHMMDMGIELTPADKDLATLMLYGLRVDTKKYLTATDIDYKVSPFLQKYADLDMIAAIDQKRHPREVLNMIKGMDEKEIGNYRFAVVKANKTDLVRPFADALSNFSGSPMTLAVAKVENGSDRDWIVLGRSNDSAYNVADVIQQVFGTGRGRWNAAGASMTTKMMYKKFKVDESKDLSVLKQVLESLEAKLKKLSNAK